MRVVAVFVPHFAVVAHRRRDGDLRRRPLVLVATRQGKEAVVACSPDAVRVGVAVGMSGAAAACAGTAVLPLDLAHCRAEHNRVREALLGLAPEVEDEALGCWCFRSEGLERLHGGEAGLAAGVKRGVLVAGYTARVAVATGRFTAIAAARYGRHETACVPRGREAAALAPLPVEAAPLGRPTLDRLRLLGVRTLGQLARLPEASVRARFGVEGAHAQRLARGLDPAPLAPVTAPAVAEASEEFESVVVSLDELLFRVRTMCDGVLGQLAARGLACWEARLEIDAEGGDVAIPLRLSRPTLSPRALWTLLRLRLERVELSGPTRAARLVAVDVQPAQPEQRELFRAYRDAERLEAAVERLRSRFGSEGAVSPLLVETHRPEARLRWRRYDLDAGVRAGSVETPAGRILRLVSPPERLEARERLGRIVCFTGTGLTCQVARLSLPYRVSGEWWGDEYDRDYYVVITQDGRLLWVFRERDSGEWFVQGEFD